MHEVFLGSVILGSELDFYLRVLQGICIMQPNHFVHRRIIFEGPKARQLKGIDPAFIKQQGPQKAPIWQSLHEQLVRQSYYLTGSWEVEREKFGKRGADGNLEEGSGLMDCNSIPGTLRWADLPDPPNSRKVNGRHIIQIENEKNICEIMKRINYRLWAENFRETYQFVSGNIVVEFTRFFRVPNQKANPLTQLSPVLPPFEELELFDGGGEDKWIVTAYLLVGNSTDQDLMKEGVDEMRTFQRLMEGSLDLEEVDRHDMDSRVR